MADAPSTRLVFSQGCPDCARPEAVGLPEPLPDVGNDFDWQVRDYDGFRLAMLEELAARFPERTRWNAADLEVVLVELLASGLDQLSDMLDRVHGEAFLESARRPESVRRLLDFIGFDAVVDAFARGDGTVDTDPRTDRAAAEAELERAWASKRWLMDDARRAGPRSVHQQQRMVSLDDCAALLEDHPLVLRASAAEAWGGAWTVVRAAVVGWNDRRLDDAEGAAGVPPAPAELLQALREFERRHELPDTPWVPGSTALLRGTTFRGVLTRFLDHYRMAGLEVVLADAVPVGIVFSLAVQVGAAYFQSEVRREVARALARTPGGFFEPGRLSFGEDVRASDLIQAVASLDGVETVALTRFKRAGSQYLDQRRSGRIQLDGLELAVCDNDLARGDRGYYLLQLSGGRPG